MDMRISGAYSTYAAYNTKRTNTPAGRSRAGASATDSVSFSATANELNVARMALGELPDVREDFTARLAGMIQSGAYNISGAQVAARIFGADE